MQIKLLTRTVIDDIQWNARVEQSGRGLPYALTNYLDIVTDRNWGALVADNYEAIFPLPANYKAGILMNLQPPFTQQLGLIANNYSVELLSEFLNLIPQKKNIVHIKGNEFSDVISHDKLIVRSRTNMILSLDRDYESIKSNFSKSLKKRIRKSSEYYEVVESNDVDLIVSMYQKEMHSKVKLKDAQYDKARRLFQYLINSDYGMIYLAKHEDRIEGSLFVIQYRNRIINLFGSSTSGGKNNFAMHTILNFLIEKNANRKLIFDFEGSDLPGVKSFYESFGPNKIIYPEYYFEQLPMWFKLIRKLKSSWS